MDLIMTDQEALKEKFKTIYEEFRKIKQEDEDVMEENEQSCKFAFITFRSMDALDYVLKAYSVSNFVKWFQMNQGSEKQKTQIMSRHFFKRWPTVAVAPEPDNIKWPNLKYTKNQRRCRSSVIWLIALLLTFFSMLAIVYMKDETIKLKRKFKTKPVCEPEITKRTAWLDINLPSDKQEGEMSCFCKAEIKKNAV